MSQGPDAGRACVLVRTTATDRSPRAPIVARYSRGVGLFESTSETCSHRLMCRRRSARRPVSQGPWQSFLATCLGKTDQGRKAGHDAWGISRHARGTSSSRTRANCLPTGSSKRKVADRVVGSMSGLGSRDMCCGRLARVSQQNRSTAVCDGCDFDVRSWSFVPIGPRADGRQRELSAHCSRSPMDVHEPPSHRMAR